ncbi:pentatricopeptide repeat-containing protein At5g02830, chloroplastic isoform X2 [Cryptomeria japonica]|uniref:pentatricopeptide repeat-containing protein At5g02830, chloroplastic isoform X2 n=1 Tax=Cryptomeria japonica TaxID=3369 RepID=UPI0027DA7C5C|nr:pentatricopeptide repeat-containing protein At5g02830, chloroplastic isoform X2 [Cryptomeria japonica]
MSRILIAGFSQLSLPLTSYTKIQDPKPTLGIRGTAKVSAGMGPVLVDVQSKCKPQRVEYYKWLAAKLAEEGRLSEFASLILTMREAGTNITNFVQQLEMEVVRAGFARGIENGELYAVLGTLSSLHRAGCHSPKFLDDNAIRVIANECRKLVEKGNVKECIHLLHILSDCHFPIKDFVEPTFMIQQCVKLKKIRMAFRYVDLLPLPHVWFNFLIRESGKQGDLMSALIAFQRSQREAMSANMYSYRDIIDACGLCGKPERARIIFKNSGVTADMTTYNILLKTWSIAGKVDLAEHLYKEILNREAAGELKMDVIAYSTMIQVFGKAKMWALAMEVKRDMIAAGIIPDVVTWTSLIGACANAGLVEKAIQIFDEMLSSGCVPNTQCCNTLLHACVKSCQYARAFHLFNNWKKNGLYLASANSENLHTESKNHRMQLSSPVFYNGVSKTVEFKPTVVTYNIMMKACGSAPYLVKSFMEEMEMIGLVPDCVSWSILIDAYGNAKDLRGALQTFSKMNETGVRPDSITYTTAIKACVKNKNPEKAFLIFETMKKYRIQPNLVTYNTLLRARRNYGNLAEVQQSLAIYEEMRIAGYAPDDNLLKGLLEEWAEGAIQHNNYRNLDQLPKEKTICKGREDTRQVVSYAGLFQKIATHARPDNINNLIRVDRLTKTEARIAVLAVLRILKERHGIGNPIKDDLTIITGLGDTQDSRYDAVVKVLKDELGLLVSSHKDDLDPKGHIAFEDEVCQTTYHQRLSNRISSHQDSSMYINASSLSGKSGIAIRRPPTLGWLRVSSESLNQWLRKKRLPAKDTTGASLVIDF